MSFYTLKIDLPHLGNTLKQFPNFNLDCLSKSQIMSKQWMINELIKCKVDLSGKAIALLAGWYGMAAQSLYDICPDIRFIRSFDWDPDCAPIAESINKELLIDGWKFKATTYGIANLNWKGKVKYHTQKEDGSYQFMVDKFNILINTSCEHMNNQWVRNVGEHQLIVAQSNDQDIPEHINTSESPEVLAEKLTIKNILYKGKLNTGQYTRSMVIGYK